MSQPSDSSRRIQETLNRWNSHDDNNRLFPIDYGDLVSEEKPVDTWGAFEEWINGRSGVWVFRGHADEYWILETTLGRTIEQVVETSRAASLQRFVKHQKDILIEFQREAHQYIPATPADDEVVDWLALAQHHGAPTRLLDWTRSAYVALYFALEKSQPKRESAVWAVDLEWLEKTSTETLLRHAPGCPDPSNVYARTGYISGLLNPR